MRAKLVCTKRKSALAIVIVILVASLCSVPLYFRLIPIKGCKTTPGISDKILNLIKYDTILTILFNVIPFLILIIVNTLLISLVVIATRHRKQMGTCRIKRTTQGMLKEEQHSQREQNKITRMLVCVVVVYMICHIPNAILVLIYEFFWDRLTNPSNVDKIYKIRLIANNISNALQQFNATSNFFLYSVLSQKFQLTAKILALRIVGSITGKKYIQHHMSREMLSGFIRSRGSRIFDPAEMAFRLTRRRASLERITEEIPLSNNNNNDMIINANHNISNERKNETSSHD